MTNRCPAHARLVLVDLPNLVKIARVLRIPPDDYRPLQHVYETIAWHYRYCQQCVTWKNALISPPTDPATAEKPTIPAARTQETPPASGGEVPCVP